MSMTRLRMYLPALGWVAVGILLSGVGLIGWDRANRLGAGPPAKVEEPPPRAWEASVYLPLADNQGKRFPEADLQAALTLIVRRFGGATFGEEWDGYWLNDQQRLQREPVRRLIVSFERHRLGEFRQVLRDVGRRLGQKVVYFRLEEPRVELLQVADAGPEKER
jgi:hypothetical protein